MIASESTDLTTIFLFLTQKNNLGNQQKLSIIEF